MAGTVLRGQATVQGALNGRKTVYLVTLRALAEEKYRQFNLYYGSQEDKWFDVSIATGDHTEGGWANGILVSTYEKFLAQISGNQEINLSETIIILDEIQILSDKTRGSDIEILCTIIKRHKPHQFIGLSATLPNAKEIADWLECDCIEVKERDVPLKQEVWYQGERYYRYHNADDTYKDDKFSFQSTNTEEIVNYLLSEELGPILVFTMTRPRARELANFLSRIREIKTQSMVMIFPRISGHQVKNDNLNSRRCSNGKETK